jgi:hypothetical protein
MAPCNTYVAITATKLTKAVTPASVLVNGKSSTSVYMNIELTEILKEWL